MKPPGMHLIGCYRTVSKDSIGQIKKMIVHDVTRGQKKLAVMIKLLICGRDDMFL